MGSVQIITQNKTRSSSPGELAPVWVLGQGSVLDYQSIAADTWEHPCSWGFICLFWNVSLCIQPWKNEFEDTQGDKAPETKSGLHVKGFPYAQPVSQDNQSQKRTDIEHMSETEEIVPQEIVGWLKSSLQFLVSTLVWSRLQYTKVLHQVLSQIQEKLWKAKCDSLQL